MSEAGSFHDLLSRVRAGDEAAAAELVRQFEPAVRRAARLRLADSRLARLLDSVDVCQSVLASFFVRAASGQYDLDGPRELVNLLVRMARNKLASAARRQRRQRRDERRDLPGQDPEQLTAAPSPSEEASGRELFQEVQRRLSPQERQRLELRQQGLEWAEIAARLGGTPEGLRKKLGRAVDWILRQLEGDETGHA